MHEGFGWIDGDVCFLEPEDKSFKVPHMGWNTLTLRKPHALFEGIETGARRPVLHGPISSIPITWR